MIKRNNKVTYLLLAGMLLTVGFLWLSLRPTEIIAVHRDGSHSNVLVKSFPFTAKGKIEWWLENKEMLKSRYDIPKSDPDGYFTVNFWLFGDGYKEEGKYDRFCFSDMKTEKNCIEKELLFSIDKSKNFGISFTANNSYYRLKKNGKVVKFEF